MRRGCHHRRDGFSSDLSGAWNGSVGRDQGGKLIPTRRIRRHRFFIHGGCFGFHREKFIKRD